MDGQLVCPICGNNVRINTRHEWEVCPWCRRKYLIQWDKKGNVALINKHEDDDNLNG